VRVTTQIFEWPLPRISISEAVKIIDGWATTRGKPEVCSDLKAGMLVIYRTGICDFGPCKELEELSWSCNLIDLEVADLVKVEAIENDQVSSGLLTTSAGRHASLPAETEISFGKQGGKYFIGMSMLAEDPIDEATRLEVFKSVACQMGYELKIMPTKNGKTLVPSDGSMPIRYLDAGSDGSHLHAFRLHIEQPEIAFDRFRNLASSFNGGVSAIGRIKMSRVTAVRERWNTWSQCWELACLVHRSKDTTRGPIREWSYSKNEDWLQLHGNDDGTLTVYSSFEVGALCAG